MPPQLNATDQVAEREPSRPSLAKPNSKWKCDAPCPLKSCVDLLPKLRLMATLLLVLYRNFSYVVTKKTTQP